MLSCGVRPTDIHAPLCSLDRLPADFGQLQCVTKLNLQHNALIAFPDSFLWLTQLEHLDITHNLFKTVTDHIGKVRRCLSATRTHLTPGPADRMHAWTAREVEDPSHVP